jgi:hypothetical protein
MEKEGVTAEPGVENQDELRKTIERGIAKNELERALRGNRREGFYMEGRMEGRSAVLRPETEKLRLKVGGYEGGGKQGIVYDVTAQEEKKGQSHTRSPSGRWSHRGRREFFWC